MTTIELTQQEWQALIDDHSAALVLLRDLVRDEPKHYDGCLCIMCRVRMLLFTKRIAPTPEDQ